MLGPFWGWVCPGGGQVGMPDPISLWGDEYAWFQVPSGDGWVCPGVGMYKGRGMYTHPTPRHGTRQVHPRCRHLLVATEAGDMHPTGMLSCGLWKYILTQRR